MRSYVRGGDGRYQVRFLMDRAADFETLVTVSETEALILENNLIKQYKPRYNIKLQDDKSYVSVKVTVKDAWPRILVTRKIERDGSLYLGPYASASGHPRDPRNRAQDLPAAHLLGRGVSQPLAAVPRVPDQALPGARACSTVDRAEYERQLEGAIAAARRQDRRAGAPTCAPR